MVAEAMGKPREIPPEGEPGIPKESGRLETPKHGAGKLRRGITESMKANVGRPDKQTARDRVLNLMDSHAFKRDEAILKGSCLCPGCKKEYNVIPSVQESEGAANRVYRYGLGTQDKVELANEDAPRAFARTCVKMGVQPEDLSTWAKVFESELGLTQ